VWPYRWPGVSLADVNRGGSGGLAWRRIVAAAAKIKSSGGWPDINQPCGEEAVWLSGWPWPRRPSSAYTAAGESLGWR